MKSIHAFVTTAIVMAVTVPSVHAGAIIFGNLPQTNDDDASYPVTAQGALPGIPNLRTAIVFLMGPQSYALDHVALRLSNYNTVAGDVAKVGFYLANDNDLPGALFGNLLVNPFSASDEPSTFNFVPLTPITFAASTKYFLMLDASAGDYVWRGSSPPIVPTSQVGADDPGRQYGFVNDQITSFTPVLSSLEIVAIPEPRAGLLIVLGSLCGACTALQRHRDERGGISP